jgi:hypothetical protein
MRSVPRLHKKSNVRLETGLLQLGSCSEMDDSQRERAAMNTETE